MRVPILSSYLQRPGLLTVAVVNPAPSGGSNSAVIRIE
jgi:hypothetical protein